MEKPLTCLREGFSRNPLKGRAKEGNTGSQVFSFGLKLSYKGVYLYDHMIPPVQVNRSHPSRAITNHYATKVCSEERAKWRQESPSFLKTTTWNLRS
jgi:hypothetical protein